MDLIAFNYKGVLRRWSVLIIAATLLAALIGYRVALRSREAARPHYAGTADVVVHYVTPPGVAYMTTLQGHTGHHGRRDRQPAPRALERMTQPRNESRQARWP